MKHIFPIPTVLFFFVLAPYIISGQAIQRPEPALVVDGVPIENAVKTIGGKTFVDIDAIADALRLTVRRSSTAVVLQSATKNIANSQASSGSIVGNLVYYFNRNYGNKPDVGAKIYLIDASLGFSPIKTDIFLEVEGKLTLTRNKTEQTDFAILHKTAADGNGRFEIKNIPPGKYTVILKSSHANAINQLEVLGKVLVKAVEITAGSSIDLSHDFGMTGY